MRKTYIIPKLSAVKMDSKFSTIINRSPNEVNNVERSNKIFVETDIQNKSDNKIMNI